MMNTMTYREYKARIEFDARDNIFVGRVLGIADSITFHGDRVSELSEAFHNAIEHYVLDCAKTGRVPQKPASGRLMLRVPPEIHAAASIAAQAAGKSLNQWAAEVLARATE